MKRILIGLTVLLVAANVAKAQTIENDLVGLGMQPEQASYLASVIPLGSTFDNAAWFKARNAADSADINVLRVDATDDTELASDAGDVIKIRPAGDANRLFTLDAASDTAHTLTFGDGGTTAAQTLLISASTGNGDDDAILQLSGAGAVANARGGYLELRGENAASSSGNALLSASGNVLVNGTAADSTIVLYTNNSPRWTVNADGTLDASVTDAGFRAAAGANTACTTTCGASKGCLFGYDIGTTALVACNSALADSCICTTT